MFSKNVYMETSKDRYVTPTFDARGYSNIEFTIPTLDADSDVYVQRSRYPHEFGYPYYVDGPTHRKYAANDIILEFRFDDADGTTILDSVTGMTLTEQGDPTYAVTSGGVGLGKGVTYDGTGDQHDILKSAFPAGLTMPTTGDFSVEMVFKATTGHDTDVLMSYMNGAFDGGGVGWSFQLDGNEYLDFAMDDGTQVVLTGATDVADGTVKHAVASLDRDGNGVIYLNGTADDTTDISARTASVDPAAGATTRLAIGGDAARGATENFWGTIYFARVYNKALSASEALNNYRTLLNLGGPFAWNTIRDPNDGDDLVVCSSGNDPGSFDLSLYMPLKHDFYLRGYCVTEQTATNELQFQWNYRG